MDKSKKKPHIVKKLSLCFPFKFEHLVISSDTTVSYLVGRMKIVFSFNTKTKSSLKFGINSCLKLVQNQQFKEPLLLFVFYDDSIKLLIDLLILKCKDRENTKIYLIDNSFRKEFATIFKIKKIFAFCLVKNEANEQVFREIIENYKNFEQNKMELVFNNSEVVKEVTSEKIK